MWKNNKDIIIRRKKYFVLAVLLTAIVIIMPFCSVQAAQTTSLVQLASGSAPGTNPGTGNVTNPGTTPASGETTNSGPITTQLTAQGRTVTLTVNISQNSQVSSGRIKIHYASDMLKLTGTQGGNLWAIEDINTGLSEAGQSVIAFAWADTQKLVNGGKILTATWEAQDKANGQEMIVETEIEEMFSQEDPVAVSSGLRIDRLRTNFEVAQPGTANGTGTNSSTNQTSVRTGDNSNLMVYILLCIGAAAVMAGLVCWRLKKR